MRRGVELDRYLAGTDGRPGFAGAIIPPGSSPAALLKLPKLRKLLRSFSRSTTRGRRDYVIILCLSELALRSHEVAASILDDLDWRDLTLSLAPTKQRQQRLLPLRDRVAQGILRYLKHGRPQHDFKIDT